MPPVTYAVLAIFLYATQNVLIDQKLRGLSTPSLLLVCYAAATPLALAALLQMKRNGEPVIWPVGATLVYALCAGALYFFADSLLVSAYTQAGANLFAVTVCAALLPVFVMLIGAFIGARPNGHQIAAMVFAAIAVGLVARGDDP